MTGQQPHNRMAEAARQAAQRAEEGRRNPEPSLGARLGQIGVLGWMIVIPTLLAVLFGRWLDNRLETGIFVTAPSLMIGAAIGFWLAWRWMHRQL
jgi:ATP synthase protein I